MIRKLMILLCFMLSFLFAFASIQNTAAISSTLLERNATATIANDNKAALTLQGFDASSQYDLNNEYMKVGSITNNTNQTLQLTIVITPDAAYQGSNYRLRFKFGSEECEIRKTYTRTELTINLSPGQTIPVLASLLNKNNTNRLAITFQFSVTAINQSYTVILEDTINSPRRIIYY